MEKKAVADFKNEYPVNIRLGFIGGLLVAIALFALAPKEFYIQPTKVKAVKATELENITMKVEDLTPPPPQQEQAVPVEAAEGEEVEATTIASTQFSDVYTPVEEKVDVPVVDFFKVEKKPQVIQSHTPEYPKDAKENGWAGTVFVEALVGPDGKVHDVRLAQSSGYTSLDQAALNDARLWLFSPGEQRGQPVKVWVNIPFHFKQ